MMRIKSNYKFMSPLVTVSLKSQILSSAPNSSRQVLIGIKDSATETKAKRIIDVHYLTPVHFQE